MSGSDSFLGLKVGGWIALLVTPPLVICCIAIVCLRAAQWKSRYNQRRAESQRLRRELDDAQHAAYIRDLFRLQHSSTTGRVDGSGSGTGTGGSAAGGHRASCPRRSRPSSPPRATSPRASSPRPRRASSRTSRRHSKSAAAFSSSMGSQQSEKGVGGGRADEWYSPRRTAVPPGPGISAPRAPIERRFVVESSALTKVKKLGEGAFGLVYLGDLHGEPVAIKEIKQGVESEKAREEFIGEALSMQNTKPHANVVLLYGICKDPLTIVQELCAMGALVDYLHGEKAERNADVLSDADITSIVIGIARGLAHLHRNNIVHRDLAARNVLLTETKVAKLADFGMARDGDLDAVYQRTTTNIGPIKWMAPEQLLDLKFSVKSDVWSFGVVLYEIYARSEPWSGTPITIVPMRVIQGERLDLGGDAPDTVKALVSRCWSAEPTDRPTAVECVARLHEAFGIAIGDLLSTSVSATADGYQELSLAPKTSDTDAFSSQDMEMGVNIKMYGETSLRLNGAPRTYGETSLSNVKKYFK